MERATGGGAERVAQALAADTGGSVLTAEAVRAGRVWRCLGRPLAWRGISSTSGNGRERLDDLTVWKGIASTAR